VRARLAQPLAAFRVVARNPALRNLQLAGVGSTLGVWAYSVAIAVYAYRADGAGAVGLLYFARWALAGAFAPWLAVLADRFPRRRVMLVSDSLFGACVGGMAVAAAAGASPFFVYALSVLGSIAGAAFGPAESALMPSLTAEPDELTAANVALGTTASVGMFAGPALAGALLAVASPWLVFALTAVCSLWSMACVARIPVDSSPASEASPEPVTAALLGGFRAIASERRLRLLVGLTGAQTLVSGALEVLIVVVALRLLHGGNGAVGWVNAAIGVGSVFGALAVGVLGGRLARNLGLGLAIFGLSLALIAVWPRTAAVVVLFAVLGIGSTVAGVAGTTLLQRATGEEVLGRVFGVLESLGLLTFAVGAVVTPALVRAAGPRGALVVAGALLPVLYLVLRTRLREIDDAAALPVERLELLRGISIFALLPSPVLERLAVSAGELTVPAGGAVVRQGEPGELFYAIEDGSASADVDGHAVRRLEKGDFFGEIALLRDVPRTATVRALDELRLLTLEREPFLAAVLGHAPSRAKADQVVAARLPAGAPI